MASAGKPPPPRESGRTGFGNFRRCPSPGLAALLLATLVPPKRGEGEKKSRRYRPPCSRASVASIAARPGES